MGYEIPAEFLAKTFRIEGLKKKEVSTENYAFKLFNVRKKITS